MDIRNYNRSAWDAQVKRQNPWTVPVTSEQIASARAGNWEIVLTPILPVPRDWFPPLADMPTLCLASGGGQQGPILAAAGARVTVFDQSPRQLAQDRHVADRDGLAITTVEGDMADLSAFDDGQFGLIVHPVSNIFVPDILPVWREAFRVLRPGGVLLAGLSNPVQYIFDYQRMINGELVVRHAIPYSDLHDLSPQERETMLIEQEEPFIFGHSLQDQIGGQLAAGFVLTGFLDDRTPREEMLISEYIATYAATRALKLPTAA